MHLLTHTLLHTSPLFIYLIVAVILMLESAGVPIVNDALLLFTGALASAGQLNIEVLVAAALLGSITGACLSYAIGVWGGRPAVLRLAALFHIDAQKITVTECWFQKSGVWMIFFSRIIPFVRPFACFVAGVSEMKFGRFIVAVTTGSAISCIGVLSIGWALGRHWVRALYFMHHYMLPTIVVFLLLLALYFLVSYLVRRYLRRKIGPVSSSATSATNEREQAGQDLINV